MAKAILILDEMPKKCSECDLCFENEMWDYECVRIGVINDSKTPKENGCPLIEAPEPKEYNGDISDYQDFYYVNTYNEALSDCGVIE